MFASTLIALATALAAVSVADQEQWLGDQVLQQRMQLEELASESADQGGWRLVTLKLKVSGSWQQYRNLRALLSQKSVKILRESLTHRKDNLQVQLELQLAMINEDQP